MLLADTLSSLRTGTSNLTSLPVAGSDDIAVPIGASINTVLHGWDKHTEPHGEFGTHNHLG